MAMAVTRAVRGGAETFVVPTAGNAGVALAAYAARAGKRAKICAPVVKAFAQGADCTAPWPEPWTVASGLRVPAPLGGALMLRAIRETDGSALAVSDELLTDRARTVSAWEGLDLSPEGGATIAAASALLADRTVSRADRIVLFDTGAGWLYRS